MSPEISTEPDALDAARVQGFIEATFEPHGLEHGATERPSEDHALTQWGEECDAHGRHCIILGARESEFFVMLILRDGEPDEMGYVLEAMRDVFRAHFDTEPEINEDVPAEIAWTSPLVTRCSAVAVARELVEVDRRERDAGIDLAFSIMES